jgi:hypothetical protein
MGVWRCGGRGSAVRKIYCIPHPLISIPQTQDYTYRYILKVNNKSLNGRKEGRELSAGIFKQSWGLKTE